MEALQWYKLAVDGIYFGSFDGPLGNYALDPENCEGHSTRNGLARPGLRSPVHAFVPLFALRYSVAKDRGFGAGSDVLGAFKNQHIGRHGRRMTAPEVPATLAPLAKNNGAMGPPQHPASPPPEEASSPIERVAMWPGKGGNGFVALENGCKASLEKPEVIVNDASEQARPAEGTAPNPIVTEAPEVPRTSQPASQPAAGDQPPTHLPEQPNKPQVPAQSSLTPAQREAIGELEGILTRISSLDSGGWFQYPVTEKDAPNYHSIIKQPMCFQASSH